MTGLDWRRVGTRLGRSLGTFRSRMIRTDRPEVRPVVTGHRQTLPTCAGLLVGGTAATLNFLMTGLTPSQVFFRGVLGALGGGLVGLVAGTRLRSAGNRRATANEVDLWDPWLDHRAPGRAGTDEQEATFEVTPALAIVRPRGMSSGGEGSFPLADEVLPHAESGDRGVIWIVGPPGSGKSTALRHLASVLPPGLGVVILDEPDAATLADRFGDGLVVYSGEGALHPKLMATYRLAPWGVDERIEYLLGVDKDQCASVMARLKESNDGGMIGGIPELWAIVLDRMIADESLTGVRTALRQELASLQADERYKQALEDWPAARASFAWFSTAIEEETRWRSENPDLVRLIRHRAFMILIAADRIVATLATAGSDCGFLETRMQLEVVQEGGRLLLENPAAEARLSSILDGDGVKQHPACASLLHAMGTGWKPVDWKVAVLSSAYLDRASWPGINLTAAILQGAEMDLSDLSGAKLDLTEMGGALIRRARFRRASLADVNAEAADLSESDLSLVRAEGAKFPKANLEKANFDSASLRKASFQGANLTDARFLGANLTDANLEDAKIEGADFSGAILESTVFKGLTLSNANFDGARFSNADLTSCNLEGMSLPKADFRDARLNKALLTGSSMTGADFRGADLRNAGLAEVSWENVCLAGADLRGASFHLGSSRSGLVFSATPCEGSRTGFYTDDLLEQDFKAPEEIRKANLRGADLRGAKIAGVDFYLVDLRDAVIDPEQAEHLRRSGAILVNRS